MCGTELPIGSGEAERIIFTLEARSRLPKGGLEASQANVGALMQGVAEVLGDVSRGAVTFRPEGEGVTA
jgi:hypothetical protein